MECPHCQEQKVVKNGKTYHQDGKAFQNYLCKGCGKQFNERIRTPISRLKIPANVVSLALNMRTEGMEIRASGRVLKKAQALEALNRQVDIPATIKDALSEQCKSEEVFMSHLEVMADLAYDDQCTGANPHYPSIADLKELMLNA